MFTLYYTPSCLYCHRVLRAAEALQVELSLVDLWTHPKARNHLIAGRGRATVPVLGIRTPEGERLMGESADIVRFLEAHAAERCGGRGHGP